MNKWIQISDSVPIQGYETFYTLDMDTIFRASINLCFEFNLLKIQKKFISTAKKNSKYDTYLIKIIFQLLYKRSILCFESKDLYSINPTYIYYFNDSLLSMPSNVKVDDAQYELLKLTLLKDDVISKRNRDLWKYGEIEFTDWSINYVKNLHAHSISPMIAQIQAGVFHDVHHVVDAGGGGSSLLLASILCQNSVKHRFEYTLLDLPAICESTVSVFKELGINHHPEHIPCNFFVDKWLTGKDCYHFSNILHSWSLRECKYLMEQAFNVLPKNGKIVIHEVLLDENVSNRSWTACAFNILAYVTSGGRKLSFTEIENLLLSAGFRDISIASQFFDYTTVVAYKR